MTNQELKEAIKEISRIKSLQTREKSLRDKVIKEIKKRRKEKLNLGNGDYVMLKEVNTYEYSPLDLFSQNFKFTLSSISEFCDLVSIVKKKVYAKYGDNYLTETFNPTDVRTSVQLSYKVSINGENSFVRGIDL